MRVYERYVLQFVGLWVSSVKNMKGAYLRRLLSAQLGRLVEHANVELSSALYDLLAGQRGHSVCDLSAILAVVHQQQLQILDVVDGELEKAWTAKCNENPHKT